MKGEADPARRLCLLCMPLMGSVLWALARADGLALPPPEPVMIRGVLEPLVA